MNVMGVLASAARRRRLNEDDGGAPVVTLIPESYLAIGHKNNYGYGLSIFGLRTGYEIVGRVDIKEEINTVRFGNVSNIMVVSPKYSGNIKLFQVSGRSVIQLAEFESKEYVEGVMFSPDDSKLLVYTKTSFSIYAANPLQLLKRVNLVGLTGKQVKWRPDGTQIVFATTNVNTSYLHVYDIASDSFVNTVVQPPFIVKGFGFIDNNTKLMISFINEKPYVKVLDANAGYVELPFIYAEPENFFHDVLQGPDELFVGINASPSLALVDAPNYIPIPEMDEAQMLRYDNFTDAIVGSAYESTQVCALFTDNDGLYKKVHYVPGPINDISISPLPFTV